MELPPAFSESCVCGRSFSLPSALTYHRRTCQKTKKRFSEALAKAKEVWAAKKRRRTDADGSRAVLETAPLVAEVLEPALSIAEVPTPAVQQVSLHLKVSPSSVS